jgi:hypothetical protein
MSDAPTSGSRAPAGSPAAPVDLWRMGPGDAAVLVAGADPLLPFLPYFLGGWDLRWAGDERGPDIRADVEVVDGGDGSFRVVGHGPGGADFAFDNPYDAANGLAGALIGAFVARTPDTICIHAAAAQVGNGLVVLIGESHAGKSSVALQLAVLGNRFFGDDQVAVRLASPPTGLCLGLMPKVRTPLPADCGEPFREFVEAYTAMEGEGMVYLKLWDREAGSFGERAPVRALVFLDRVDSGPAELGAAGRAELVKAMVETAFAPHLGSAELVAGLTCLAAEADVRRLRFSSSREAAALLSRTYGRAAG